MSETLCVGVMCVAEAECLGFHLDTHLNSLEQPRIPLEMQVSSLTANHLDLSIYLVYFSCVRFPAKIDREKIC